MASITTAAAQARVIKMLLLQAHLQAQVKLFPLHASLTAGVGRECKMSRHKEDGKFVYTGQDGNNAAFGSIPNKAFFKRNKLAAVELSEGLVEIGDIPSLASITKISIPNSLRRINDYAFTCSLRTPIQLHDDDIESIGRGAFASCIFTTSEFRPSSQ